MPRFVDARVPVRFTPAGPNDALLIEGDGPAPDGLVLSGRVAERFTLAAATAHPPGCACCAPRSPAAQALARLFLARARGEAPLFPEVAVIAGPAGQAAVRAALAGDALASAWYRLADT